MGLVELEGLLDDLLLLVASTHVHRCPIAWFCLGCSGSSLVVAAMTASTSFLGDTLLQCSPWSNSWSSPWSGSCTHLQCVPWCRSWSGSCTGRKKMEVQVLVEDRLGLLPSDRPTFGVWWR